MGESSPPRLIPAERARELAILARSGIPDEVRKRAIEAIAEAVRLGHSEAFAKLSDLHLGSGIPDEELDELLKGVIEELEEAGYRVKWDDITYMFIEF